MKVYAEIVSGKVRSFHKRNDDRIPEFHPDAGITVVDVTESVPMPEQGWKYSARSREFSKPDPPDPQIAIEEKIQAEMRSTRSRLEAIERLRASGSLAANYAG